MVLSTIIVLLLFLSLFRQTILVCDIMYFETADADDCLGQGRWALSVISRAAESRYVTVGFVRPIV